MINIFTQDGSFAFSVNNVDELKAEITHTVNADFPDRHYWLVELTRDKPNYDDLNQPIGETKYCGLYRFKEDAETELLTLWRTITRESINCFHFAKSDISPLELVRLRTAFI